MFFLPILLFSILDFAQTGDTLICPDDFQLATDGRCYAGMNYPPGWTGDDFYNQSARCSRIGGNLSSITRLEEQYSLKQFRDGISTMFPDPIFYIGLECDQGHWVWTDGRDFNASAANFADESAEPSTCITDDRRFVFNSYGRWAVWKESFDPVVIVCATNTIVKGQADGDTDGGDGDPGFSWSTLWSIVGGLCILGLIIFSCWRWRKKRHDLKALVKRLTAQTKKFEEAEKERAENLKNDGWEIDRKFVAVDWDTRLGNGAFGTVFLGHVSAEKLPEKAAESIIQMSVHKKNDGAVAVKMLHETADKIADLAFREEIELMKNLGFHERLVNILACVTDSAPAMLIVEFCSKGDLLGHMKKCREYMLSLHPASEALDYTQIITEKQQFMFAVQIAYGLEFLAHRGYVHRDIAARNILVDQNDAAKIGDFGLCRKLEEDQDLYLTRGGRLPLKWMAPEALRDYEMSTASDVWSYGVLLFEIVTLGGSPYAGWSLAEVLPRLEAGERMPRPDNCPDSLYDIMAACWRDRASQRPNFTKLRTQVAQELEKVDNNFYYLQLDSKQHYYQMGSEHDQSVPEDVIFRHGRKNINHEAVPGLDDVVEIQHTVPRKSIAPRDSFSPPGGPIAFSHDAQVHASDDMSPDGYQVPRRQTPLGSVLKSFNNNNNTNEHTTDDGYQVPTRRPTMVPMGLAGASAAAAARAAALSAADSEAPTPAPRKEIKLSTDLLEDRFAQAIDSIAPDPPLVQELPRGRGRTRTRSRSQSRSRSRSRSRLDAAASRMTSLDYVTAWDETHPPSSIGDTDRSDSMPSTIHEEADNHEDEMELRIPRAMACSSRVLEDINEDPYQDSLYEDRIALADGSTMEFPHILNRAIRFSVLQAEQNHHSHESNHVEEVDYSDHSSANDHDNASVSSDHNIDSADPSSSHHEQLEDHPEAPNGNIDEEAEPTNFGMKPGALSQAVAVTKEVRIEIPRSPRCETKMRSYFVDYRDQRQIERQTKEQDETTKNVVIEMKQETE